ncbi:MAG: SIS domain-containing protein [Lentisphaeraceae bacterium]|nr:SIS domain-containing protein [Lentisphaeraceae bacterium]
MSESPIAKSFLDAYKTLADFIENQENIDKVEELSKLMASRFDKGHKVIIFGNGGSACDAAHFAEEFTGRYRKDRKALPVITVNDAGHLTCVSNDYGFKEVFRRTVQAFCTESDIVIGLSTSGNSENVILAMEEAKKRGAVTVALIGKDGGKMKDCYDFQWVIPGETSDRIQEIHMLILHIIIEGVERILFPENY